MINNLNNKNKYLKMDKIIYKNDMYTVFLYNN